MEEIFLSNGHDNGLTQVLAEQCTLAEAIEPSGVGGLDIMPSGLRPPNPSELLSGARFKVLLRELAAKYDRIVIDTPPVMAVSDALILAPQVDIVCLVVRAQRTPRHSSSRTSIALAKAGRAPSGIVLNRLPITTAGYYYYYAGTYGKKRVYGEATAG